MTAFRTALLACLLSLTACSQSPASWKGTIYRTYGTSVNACNLSARTDKTVFTDGRDPFVTASGEIVFLSEKFPKRGQLVRKRTSTGQYKDLLDLSSDNPLFRDSLANYSVIRGTGFSAVMQYMDDPRVSPNGKYISVTIIGAPRNAFPENCVAVFEIGTGNPVARFNNKYDGSWTPDNRLVMCGTYKRGSVNDPLYESAEPGIFISDAGLKTLTRIDKGLDDPSPYHATVSHDGKKIAFVMDGHIWIMNSDGSGTRQLTGTDNDNTETYPSFSPDDKFVVCWCYKTFERSYFTALAIVDAAARKPVVLSDKAPVWPKDTKGYRISGGSRQLSWVR